MTGSSTVRSFYRVAKRAHLQDKDYLTHQDRRGDPNPALSPHVRASWDGFSVFESEETARAAARNAGGNLGRFLLRFDIPAGSGITASHTPACGEGHYDLRGDKDELKRYLSNVVTEV